jgi:hypothetical protein
MPEAGRRAPASEHDREQRLTLTSFRHQNFRSHGHHHNLNALQFVYVFLALGSFHDVAELVAEERL